MCDKHQYLSSREANIHIKRIKKTSSRDTVPKRSYWCKECGYYHITSTKEERGESIEFRQSKGKFKLR